MVKICSTWYITTVGRRVFWSEDDLWASFSPRWFFCLGNKFSDPGSTLFSRRRLFPTWHYLNLPSSTVTIPSLASNFYASEATFLILTLGLATTLSTMTFNITAMSSSGYAVTLPGLAMTFSWLATTLIGFAATFSSTTWFSVCGRWLWLELCGLSRNPIYFVASLNKVEMP